MPYAKRLPRPLTASSLPCLLAALGLSACTAVPHRIAPATTPADDPKNIARAMAQPKPAAPAPVISKTIAAAESTAPSAARGASANAPQPAPASAATPASTAITPPRSATPAPAAAATSVETAKAAATPSAAATTSVPPSPEAVHQPQTATAPAKAPASHTGVLAMMAADDTVLATRLRDRRAQANIAPSPDRPAPTPAAPVPADKSAHLTTASAQPAADKPAVAPPASTANDRPATVTASVPAAGNKPAAIPVASNATANVSKTKAKTEAPAKSANGNKAPTNGTAAAVAPAASSPAPAESPAPATVDAAGKPDGVSPQPVKAESTPAGKSAADNLASASPDQAKTAAPAKLADSSGNSAPTTSAATAPAPAATVATPGKSDGVSQQPAKADTPDKSAADKAVAAATPGTKPGETSPPPPSSSEPPVVMVTNANDIRIPPASKAAAKTPAPVSTPAAAPPSTPAVQSTARTNNPAPARKPAGTAAASTVAAGKPAAVAAATSHPANTPAAASVAPPGVTGNANALYGMPLPNLPSLQGADQPAAAPAETQLARADTSPRVALQTDHSAELARIELKKAQNRILLSDAQLERLQAAQDRIASGDNGGAFVILQTLNAELQNETRSYVVQDNESMWHVAGLQEVYGNSYLWPLVWQANRDRVKKPSQLYKGLRLSFPAHPTAEEVSQALAYSTTNNLEGMNQADSR